MELAGAVLRIAIARGFSGENPPGLSARCEDRRIAGDGLQALEQSPDNAAILWRCVTHGLERMTVFLPIFSYCALVTQLFSPPVIIRITSATSLPATAEGFIELNQTLIFVVSHLCQREFSLK
jgi:hypothetical protein